MNKIWIWLKGEAVLLIALAAALVSMLVIPPDAAYAAYVDWDVKNQPDYNYAMEKLTSRIHNGAIVLLHSTSETNSMILDELLDTWLSEGYVFKSLYELK